MTLADVIDRAPADMPVGVLRDAFSRRSKGNTVADVIVAAGALRDRQAGTGDRVVRTPNTSQHGRMLIAALEPAVEHVRVRVFKSETPPGADVVLPEDVDRSLAADVRRLAQASGFQPHDVRTWILTGRAPTLGVALRLTRQWWRLPDNTWNQRWSVVMETSTPLLGEQDVRAIARDLRALWKVSGAKAWADDDIRLMRAVRRAGGPPTGEGALTGWATIARRSRLPTGRAAAVRWRRLAAKAARFGLPMVGASRVAPSAAALAALGIGMVGESSR